MPGFLVSVGSTIICPHAGQTTIVSSNTRVLLGGQPASTATDVYTVAGCPFTLPNGKPQPCVTLRWIVPAARVLIGGQPAVLQTSTGLAQSAEQIPQGPPTVVVTQVRVKGT